MRHIMRLTTKKKNFTPYIHATTRSYTLTPYIQATDAHLRAAAAHEAANYNTTPFDSIRIWLCTMMSHSDALHTCHRRISTHRYVGGTWRGALPKRHNLTPYIQHSTQWCYILTPYIHAIAAYARKSAAHDAALYTNHKVSHPIYMTLPNKVTLWHPTYMPQLHIYAPQRDVTQFSTKRHVLTPYVHDFIQWSHTLTPCIHATAADQHAPAGRDAALYNTI